MMKKSIAYGKFKTLTKLNLSELEDQFGMVYSENEYITKLSKDIKNNIKQNKSKCSLNFMKNIAYNDVWKFLNELSLNNIKYGSVGIYVGDVRPNKTTKRLVSEGKIHKFDEFHSLSNISIFKDPPVQINEIKDLVYDFKYLKNGSLYIELTEEFDAYNFDQNYYDTYVEVYDILKPLFETV